MTWLLWLRFLTLAMFAVLAGLLAWTAAVDRE
jgi:hypothetical protein